MSIKVWASKKASGAPTGRADPQHHTTTPGPGSATCPHCGDPVSITKDGTVRRHGSARSGYKNLGCPMGGKRP